MLEQHWYWNFSGAVSIILNNEILNKVIETSIYTSLKLVLFLDSEVFQLLWGIDCFLGEKIDLDVLMFILSTVFVIFFLLLFQLSCPKLCV